MNKNIAGLILLWHGVHVALGQCIESARVVLDQSDRGTLLPDRVREMRGELLAVQEMIPKLADLMEELTGEAVWPMKVDPVLSPEMVKAHGIETEAAAEEAPAEEPEPPATAAGDYDAEGSTPVEEAEVAATKADTEAAVDEEAAAEPDATGTP